MRRFLGLAAAAAVSVLLAAPAAHADEASSIDLIASPESIRANGLAQSTITAVVRGQNGAPVADGTPISFQASLGNLDGNFAVTHAGRAQVRLRSSAITGLATVSAASGRASRSIEVAFLGEGQSAPELAVYLVTVEGDHVAYSADHEGAGPVLQASGHAHVRVGSLDIHAETAQVLVNQNTVVAIGETGAMGLEVRGAGTRWKGDSIRYNWSSHQGLFAGELNGKAQVYGFAGPPLAVTDRNAPNTGAPFSMEDLSDTSFWITARRAALFPGKRIQFQQAVIRPNGHRFVTLPYHSLSLNDNDPDADQLVGIGTHGFSLDLPFFLNLTDSSATSLRFGMNQQQGGLSAYSPGFGLDVRHTLFAGNRGEDTLDFSRVTSSDYGAWFKHTRRWNDRLQTEAFVQYPAHRDLLANANLNWQMPEVTATLNLNANSIAGQSSAEFADLGLESVPRPLGHSRWLASLLTESSYARGLGGSGLTQALEARLLLPSLQLDRHSSVSASFTGGDIVLGSARGLVADAVLGVNHQFGRNTFFSANYTFTQRPAFGDLLSPHRISANFFTQSPTHKWSLVTSSSLSLDGRSAAFSTDFDYAISRAYRVGITTTYVRAENFPFTDYEFSLTRKIAGRDFTLYWSRQRRHLGIQFGSAVF